MKKIIILISIFSILFNVTPLYAESLNFENARSYILIDSKSGQVLYGHNIDQKLYPASVTKIMTAIIALEKGDLNTMMTASESAVYDIGDGGMNIGIMPGEELRMEDLLNAMLIISANETANILAENISPTRKDFIDLMNKKAVELGALNTNFVTTCGAHDPNHYSTASDFAKIARYAMQIPKFREIVRKSSYQMSPTNKHSKWDPLHSTNKLLGQSSEFFTDVIGIKTGYTSQAGNNLASAANYSDGTELISVVFGVFGPNAKNDVISYSKQLLEYGFRNYSLQTIANPNQVIRSVDVANSRAASKLDLVTAEEFKCVLPKDASLHKITEYVDISSNIKAPISKGQVLGFIEYRNDNVSLGKVDLVASAAVDEKAPPVTAETAKAISSSPLKKVILTLLFILAAFIILRIILRRISRNLRAKGQQDR